MSRNACLSLCALSVGLLAPYAAAQTGGAAVEGVIFLDDPESDSRCALVNTSQNEFIIRTCDRQLIFVTMEDEETGYVVDSAFNVTLNGAPRGRIGYALDGSGFRTLFWVTDNSFGDVGPGFVLDYDPSTGTVSPAMAAGSTQPIPPTSVQTAGQFCDPSSRFDGAARCPTARAPCGAGGVQSMIAVFSILTLATLVSTRRRPL